ncbi:hypothetical protein DINM_000901 [Dirofilaria immitis]|nr:hypothetical protein [Dirofilaria immitis]
MGGETSKIRRPKSSGPKKPTIHQSIPNVIPPEIKTDNSINCTDNLLNVGFGYRAGNSSRLSLDLNINRSRSGSICSSRSISKQKHPIPIRDRNLIQSCFQNPHEIIGHKILQRAYEKRNGFANFYSKLSNDEKDEIEEGIKVQRLAEEFGGRHVFSSVRDGFYGEMRRMRRASNSFSTGSNSSYMRKTISGDFNTDLLPRSASPGDESGESEFSAVIVIPADT